MKKCISLILIIMTILLLTGCTSINEEKTLEDKTNEEISYLENCIFTIVNKYVKREYTKDDEIIWEDIEKDAKKINDALDIIILDLSEYNISAEDILDFRNEINNITISIVNKNEQGLLENCDLLYSKLPIFLESYSKDKNKISIMQIKSLVLDCLISSNINNWDDAKNIILMAESKYNSLIDDAEFIKEFPNDLNKIYVLIEEVKNAVDMEELELVKVKYINFIEKI